jgi:tRNA A-37 threonylcarbamoyl transferase component Bud32
MNDPERLGKYEIRSVLGRGAMGIVYKGYDPHIERTVAIKTVRKDLVDKELTAQFLSRFRNEARAAGRLHHPNIVGIYEYGEDDNVAFIAMEFVDGIGLREYLDRKARFEFGQLVNIMGQLLHALEFAHERGVVHRDIKPANLIMTAKGELKIADFGIARIDTSELTMDGTVLGTPSYMSPEQCTGRPSDHRSDLFSAAVVFYELLAGEKPFTGTLEALMYQICTVEPRPPSQVAKLVLPVALDEMLLKALAKSPDARFQTAREFRLALAVAVGAASSLDGADDATLLNMSAGALPPAPKTWDDTILTTAERELARFVGPLAKLLVRKAAAKTTDVGELYSILATNIGDPQQRRRFVEEPHAGDTHAQASRAGTHTGGGTHPGGGATEASSSHRTRSTGGGTAPAVPLEQAFVDDVTARLAVYLGPIAKIVAKKAALQAANPREFVRIVASQIGTQDRRTFLAEMGQDDGS